MQCRKTCPVIDELLEAQCGKFESLKLQGPHSWGSPTFMYALPSESIQILTVNTRKNSLHDSSRGQKKKPFENMLENSDSKAYPQVKLFHQSLICWGFIRIQTIWGKGNTQLQPILSHVGEEEYWEALVKFRVQGYRLSMRLRSNYRTC